MTWSYQDVCISSGARRDRMVDNILGGSNTGRLATVVCRQQQLRAGPHSARPQASAIIVIVRVGGQGGDQIGTARLLSRRWERRAKHGRTATTSKDTRTNLVIHGSIVDDDRRSRG